MQDGDRHRARAGRRRHAPDRAGPHLARRGGTRHARLPEARGALRRAALRPEVRPGGAIPFPVARDGRLPRPFGAGPAPDGDGATAGVRPVPAIRARHPDTREAVVPAGRGNPACVTEPDMPGLLHPLAPTARRSLVQRRVSISTSGACPPDRAAGSTPASPSGTPRRSSMSEVVPGPPAGRMAPGRDGARALRGNADRGRGSGRARAVDRHVASLVAWLPGQAEGRERVPDRRGPRGWAAGDVGGGRALRLLPLVGEAGGVGGGRAARGPAPSRRGRSSGSAPPRRWSARPRPGSWRALRAPLGPADSWAAGTRMASRHRPIPRHAEGTSLGGPRHGPERDRPGGGTGHERARRGAPA